MASTFKKQKSTILIIDDSKAIRDLTAIILEEEGYNVNTANNGKTGLAQVERTKYDLILLDIVMPDMSGFQIIEIIKTIETNKHTPIIFLTGVSDDENVVLGLKLGANDFIPKPFKKEVLLARIEAQIKLSSAYNDLQNEILEKELLIKKINSQKRDLNELNTTKDKILSILVHDIKNQVSSIFSLSDILLNNSSGFSEKKKNNYLHLIYSSSVAVNEFIQNLLGWAGKNWTKESYHPETIHLKQIVEECIGYYKGVAEVKGIDLQATVTDSSVIYSDKEMVKIIIRNLIGNGIKFTPEHGNVRISALTNSDKDAETVVIEDTGIGISKEQIPNLFDLDSTYNSSGTNGEKGTGIGLKICKEYVERNNGSITVESTVGVGTKFIIELPIKATS